MIHILRRIITLCTFLLLLTQEDYAQQIRAVDNYTVMLHCKGDIIPFKRLDSLNIAIVTPDSSSYARFVQMSQRYGEITAFDRSDDMSRITAFQTIIFAGSESDLHGDMLSQARQLADMGKAVVICTFVGSTKLSLGQSRSGGIFTELICPGSDLQAQENMAMSLFGGMAITQGDNRTEQTRLQYGQTILSSGHKDDLIKKIDAIAAEAIAAKATPGMVVMVVKNDKVIFEKAYGYHTYDANRPTRLDDIFDLASVSKIVGTTPVIMHLQEQGQVDLKKTIDSYLSDARETNKSDIHLRSVMLHEAGFTPYIPFYRKLKDGDLQTRYSDTHQVKVADGAYLLTDYYKKVMWPEMLHSSVKPVGNYEYSDISMYVMKEVAEQVTGTAMDEYVTNFLYRPLGMKTAGYNPRNRFAKDRIVPTQDDTVFRKVLLQGYVHDEGAAMAGGVAGHAGLFASANDLAIYAQMLLNRGKYGAVRYLESGTVDLFTSKQSLTSRRGLGFDRFEPHSQTGYPSKLADPSTYGHTGYTGTCIWIDPRNQLIYIFLSNRVHPQVSNKLGDLNIRSRIQDAIYETLLNRS